MDFNLDFHEKKKKLVDKPAPTHIKSWLRLCPMVVSKNGNVLANIVIKKKHTQIIENKTAQIFIPSHLVKKITIKTLPFLKVPKNSVTTTKIELLLRNSSIC